MNTQTNHLHGGNPNYFIRKFNLETKEFIDFSVNVNHFGPPEIILAAWDEFKSVIQKYPDISGKEVKKFYHHKFGLPEDSILTGNGSIECIYLVPRALKIKKVTIIQPSFFDYRKAFELINAKINMIQLSEKTEFSFPETDEIAKQLEKSDALIFGNPNNPTGTLNLRPSGYSHKNLVLFSSRKTTTSSSYPLLITIESPSLSPLRFFAVS